MEINPMRWCITFLLLLPFAFAGYIPPGPKYNCPKNEIVLLPCVCYKGTDTGLTIRCENTNIASLAVALTNLASFKMPIDELTLERCNFASLYGGLFYDLKVRILRIQETPIRDLADHIFYGINETLNELHIINSALDKFPSDAIKSLGNLTLLNIDHHSISLLDKNIFADSNAAGSLEKLRITNGDLNDVTMESLQPLKKLKTLDLHGNKIAALKKGQFKNLRDIEVLDVSFNNISKLEANQIADLTKLGWFNISTNNLNELTRGTFARNALLKVLNLSFNNIKRLDANSFRGMRFLRRLYLRENSIKEIGRGTFGSITRIGTIDLARNQLPKVDYQLFAQLNYVEEIDVSENQIVEIQKQSFKDLYLAKINISHNKLEKIEKLSFENCANITVLDLSHNYLTTFDRQTFDETTFANEFQLSYNNITDLSQVPLHNMTGIRILNVTHNNINTIPKNTFPKLYELHTIDLSFNNISSIANAVFQTLFSLRNLNLSHNSLETIRPPLFGSISTLLELDLSYNKLSTLAKGALVKLPSLRILHMQYNQIEEIFEIPISLNYLNLENNWIVEIKENTWPLMNALLKLNLANNRILNNLNSNSFTGLLTLQYLDLSNNQISEVPWESIHVLSTLQYLHLENNNITTLGKAAFGNMPVVFELNLFNNNVSSISERAFDGLLQLLTLNLSTNAIKFIPPGAFYGLVSLRRLDLSNNKIQKLDNKTHGLLDDCLSLEKVNLSRNRISFVTKKTFPSDPYIPYKLKEIDLSYNQMPVLTYDITFGTKRVKYLNVSHNAIAEIRKNVLNNLTSLEILDMSYNNLADLIIDEYKNEAVLPVNLTKFYLNNNIITKVPKKSIGKLNNLEIIDLQNNELTYFDSTLVMKIKNGTIVKMEGNPLLCDCSIRPLRHYLDLHLDVAMNYSNLVCHSTIENSEITSILTVPDDQLNCVHSDYVESLTNGIDKSEFDLLPDIRFREISVLKHVLNVKWTVASVRDIADFLIYIRNGKNKVLYEQYAIYSARELEIPLTNITDTPIDRIEICILSKSSDGTELNRWFDTQCHPLPKDFRTSGNKFILHGDPIYKIYSREKKTSTIVTNDGSALLKVKLNSIYLTIISLVCLYFN